LAAAGVAAAWGGAAPLLVEGLTEGDVDDDDEGDDDDEAGGDAFFLVVLVGGRGGGGGGAMTGLAWGIVATFSDDMTAVVGPLSLSLCSVQVLTRAPRMCV
jgi:hypothetical protein